MVTTKHIPHSSTTPKRLYSRSDWDLFQTFVTETNTSASLWKYIETIAQEESLNRLHIFIPVVHIFSGLTHLDYVGSPPLSQNRIKATTEILESYIFGNTHSLSPSAHRTDDLVNALRETILSFVGGDSDVDTVIFTNGKDQAVRALVCSLSYFFIFLI